MPLLLPLLNSAFKKKTNLKLPACFLHFKICFCSQSSESDNILKMCTSQITQLQVATRWYAALQCTRTVYIWMPLRLGFPYKMTFSPSTPPIVPSKEEEECPSSDACSIVHALPPICSPHSAASAETLRRLKGQIAHTKRQRKREKDRWGVARKRYGEARRESVECVWGGGNGGLTPLHSNAIMVCI